MRKSWCNLFSLYVALMTCISALARRVSLGGTGETSDSLLMLKIARLDRLD